MNLGKYNVSQKQSTLDGGSSLGNIQTKFDNVKLRARQNFIEDEPQVSARESSRGSRHSFEDNLDDHDQQLLVNASINVLAPGNRSPQR